MNRALVVVAALLVGCGGAQQTLTADEARSALPASTQAQVGSPGSSSSAATHLTVAQTGTQAAVATAEYAADTIALATAVNGGVAWTLGIVSFVASLPPSSCSGDTCTWGPGSDALDVNDWQLVVTKRASNEYAWSLQGRPKTAAGASWIAFVSGDAFTTGVTHVGHGTLSIDLDAAAGLARKTSDPAPQPGSIAATYDNTAGATVAVQFLGTQDSANPQQKVNAAYQFSSTSSGGDLQVATRNLTTAASLKLHSRWTGTGAGRGDAAYSPDGVQVITRSQCWDSASSLFNLVYQGTGSAVDSGSESACAFAPAAPPTVAVP